MLSQIVPVVLGPELSLGVCLPWEAIERRHTLGAIRMETRTVQSATPGRTSLCVPLYFIPLSQAVPDRPNTELRGLRLSADGDPEVLYVGLRTASK